MKATLIKLSGQHYIIVDDSEIKKGDWIYKTNEPHKNAISISTGGAPDGWKRISKSFGASMGSLEKSPLSEVKEAIYGYSVEKMANEKYHRTPEEYNEDLNLLCAGYSDGFVAAMELVKDKLFTVEDMINAFISGTNSGANYESIINCSSGDLEEAENFAKCEFEDFKKSLQPKTEWDIEIDEQGKKTVL
jgi:peptide methionine sulfoxide reductase MsrA